VRARNPGIRLRRGTRLSSLNLHPKPTTRGLVHIREHPWMLGQATGTLTHLTHHGLDSKEATTFPHIIYSAPLRQGYIQMAFFPRTPKEESWNCPGLESRVGIRGLWTNITSRPDFWSRRGLNQSCSSPRELSNVVLHFVRGRREEVDSQLLVVGSQIVSLTHGPSFAHYLGCRCPNGSCEAILDMYTSRPFQWHQERSNVRRFGPCIRTLSFWESRRTITSHFWECGLHPHT
jgi:hypothetical protein